MFISVGIAQQYKTPLQTRQNNQQWSPRSSRAQALRSPLVRAVTHHKQQNAPCCRREHPNLLAAILDDANHRAGGSSRRCLTPSDMFRPGSTIKPQRVASSASIAALFLQRARSILRTASRCKSNVMRLRLIFGAVLQSSDVSLETVTTDIASPSPARRSQP